MFQVDFDAARDRLDIRVAGFWKPEDLPAFAAAVGASVNRARRVSDHFQVLVQSPDFPVQANDIADMLTDVMKGGMATTTGRAAVVVGSHLGRLQAERTLVHPRLKVFISLDDAERWLVAEATT